MGNYIRFYNVLGSMNKKYSLIRKNIHPSLNLFIIATILSLFGFIAMMQSVIPLKNMQFNLNRYNKLFRNNVKNFTFNSVRFKMVEMKDRMTYNIIRLKNSQNLDELD